jgi:acetyl-CoA carboxylase carboxyltransferase component
MDFICVIRKDYARMFITGPDIVKSVCGQDVSGIELGGAMTHNSKSGEKPPVYSCSDPPYRIEESLNHIVPDKTTRPYDMKELIGHVVDNG